MIQNENNCDREVFFLYCIIDGELYHHGIKGQRWGIRRYQNPDGSLTELGRKRYGKEIVNAYDDLAKANRNLKKERAYYNKKTLGGTFYNPTAIKRFEKAKMERKWAKEDLSYAKTKQKIDDSKKEKSKHRLALEKHYLERGMTAEEAEVAAYKREITEKALAVTLGLTIAAAGAYVAYRHYDYSVDKILKSGTMLSRISKTDSAAVHDAFYVAANQSDSKKYIGLYGNAIKKNGFDVFKKSISVNENIKVASEKNALKGLQDLAKQNPSYKSELKKALQTDVFGSPKAMAEIQKGLRSIESGKIDKHVYNALNINAVDKSPAISKYYEYMKSKGYGAIRDMNDKRFSGYDAKNPLIVFDSEKVAVDAVKKLGNTEIAKANSAETAKMITKVVAGEAAKYGALGAGVKATVALDDAKKSDRIVAQYRKDHPNSKLSYNEIVRDFKKKKYE